MRSPPVAERRLKSGIDPPRKSGGRFSVAPRRARGSSARRFRALKRPATRGHRSAMVPRRPTRRSAGTTPIPTVDSLGIPPFGIGLTPVALGRRPADEGGKPGRGELRTGGRCRNRLPLVEWRSGAPPTCGCTVRHTWLAETAFGRSFILVTRNCRDFNRITGLKVDNWFD